jgi:hypothetical protein
MLGDGSHDNDHDVATSDEHYEYLGTGDDNDSTGRLLDAIAVAIGSQDVRDSGAGGHVEGRNAAGNGSRGVADSGGVHGQPVETVRDH